MVETVLAIPPPLPLVKFELGSLILVKTTGLPVIMLSLMPNEAAKPVSSGRTTLLLAATCIVAVVVVTLTGLCVGVGCVVVWEIKEEVDVVVFTVASVNMIQFKLTTNKIKIITVVITTIRLVTNLLPSELKIIGKQLMENYKS